MGADPLLLAYYGDDFTGSTDALEFLTRAGARTALFIAPPTPEQLAEYGHPQSRSRDMSGDPPLFPSPGTPGEGQGGGSSTTTGEASSSKRPLPGPPPEYREREKDPPQVSRGLQAIGVAGMTRSMTPEAMEAELRPAFAALRALGAPHVHYKVCSTFDSSPTIGSIGRAIDVGASGFQGPFVPLLVGAPPLGRYCVFGNLFARMGIGSDGAVHRLDRHPSMSRHPVTPADESDLRLHLGRQTQKRIGLFNILQVARGESEARAALEELLATELRPEIVLFDVLYADQLARIGAMIDGYARADRPLFSVGSSGVEMALGAHWATRGGLREVTSWPEPGPAEPLLVISGSCSPVTERQITWAMAHGFMDVALDTAAIAGERETSDAIDRAAMESAGHLRAGRSVIVHTSRGDADPRVAATAAAFARRDVHRLAAKVLTAKLFGTALGQVARRAIESVPIRRLLIAGGDTSSYAARALGIESVEMIAPLAPGAPLCRAHAPGSPADGLELNFKGGQVGNENYFGSVARGAV
jgi:3-oxoisoapionate kinase